MNKKYFDEESTGLFELAEKVSNLSTELAEIYRTYHSTLDLSDNVDYSRIQDKLNDAVRDIIRLSADIVADNMICEL